MKPREAKNHYEYLIIEDLKPAGFEPVKIHGGEQLSARELKSSATEKMFEKSRIASSPAIHYQANRPNPAQIGKQLYGPLSPQLRDRKTALFTDKLPREIREICHTRRAEVPDQFHALPVLGRAMYILEIRANGAEIRMTVKDRNSKDK